METITIVAFALFAITYILMMALQKIRTPVALCSAGIFVLLGILAAYKPDIFGTSFLTGFDYTPREALREIDWNVILMIVGTMGIVHLFIQSKMPQRMAEILISRVSDVRWAVLVLSVFAGFVSAFVDNVATVLMIAPVALAFCEKVKVSPVPAVICIAVSSNLQGAATLVGDTTSILLSKAAGLDFFDFFYDHGHVGIFWIVEAGALASAVMLFLMFRKERESVTMEGHTRIEDKVPTILLLGTVISLILFSFIPYKSTASGSFYKPDVTNGLICVFFFLVGLVREWIKHKDRSVLRAAMREMDYQTILLLIGLFVIIGGIESAGVIDVIGDTIAKVGNAKGSAFLVYTVIVWASVLLSSFIDNIPYTATMLSVVTVIAAKLPIDPKPLYYGLLCGATLGGNLTPIGASANITGIGILRKKGYEVKARTYMKYGVPFTLAAVSVGYLLIWLAW